MQKFANTIIYQFSKFQNFIMDDLLLVEPPSPNNQQVKSSLCKNVFEVFQSGQIVPATAVTIPGWGISDLAR